MTIFSMLFGAGVLLTTERWEARGVKPRRIHFRRMWGLLLFGLIHGYLLWDGDILFWYAVCGMIVYMFRNRPPGVLISTGLALIAFVPILLFCFGISFEYWPPDVAKDFTSNWNPSAEKIAEQLATYRGSYIDQLSDRAEETFSTQTLGFLFWGIWRVTGLMLLGMALLKLGVISGKGAPGLYWTLVATALLVGVPAILFGIARNIQGGWEMEQALFYTSNYNYWGSLLVALGWISAVMLAFKNSALPGIARRLAAVGQMAFSNYIGHTLICTFIFYGIGLGLYGKLERVEQMAIMAAIWALQLIVSPMWLARYRFGPLEWLWRSLTYQKAQPMRRVDQPD
jgi:uncharacterized protein